MQDTDDLPKVYCNPDMPSDWLMRELMFQQLVLEEVLSRNDVVRATVGN